MPEHRKPSLRDRLELALARFIVGLPPRLRQTLAGKPIVLDRQTLDPEVQILLAGRRWLGIKGLRDHDLPRARRRMSRESAMFSGAPPAIGAVRDFEIGKLPARHYAPITNSPAPLLVFLHGGGFVLGDLESHDAVCRFLCHHAGIHVVAVDYRLAPEHPFPAATEDAYAALVWAQQHAAELGADPTRVGIGGDSAGGNLATVASQLAAQHGAAPQLQLLLYPTIDRRRAHRSYYLFGEGFLLNHEDVLWFDAHYSPGVDRADPRLSPAAAKDLKGLPRAIVVTAGFDPLRDEGEAYAAALSSAGVQATVMRFAGMVHGFVHMIGVSPSTHAAFLQVALAVKSAFAESAAKPVVIPAARRKGQS